MLNNKNSGKRLMSLKEAEDYANKELKLLARFFDPNQLAVYVVGSIRRRKAVVNDVDLLLVNMDKTGHPYPISETVVDMLNEVYPTECVILASGNSKIRAVVDYDGKGFQLDINIVHDPDTLGSQLLHHTGSAQSNILMRKVAMRNNWSLSQHGLKDKETGKIIASLSEKEIYNALSMEYEEPEDR